MLRYAEFTKLAFPETRRYDVFIDNADIADYAQAAVEAFYKAGVLTGKSNNLFDPRGQATRAEVAAILHRLVEAIA